MHIQRYIILRGIVIFKYKNEIKPSVYDRFLIVLMSRRHMLPLIPVKEQKIKVNQLMLSLSPVINEIKFKANREPMPDAEDTAKVLKK